MLEGRGCAVDGTKLPHTPLRLASLTIPSLSADVLLGEPAADRGLPQDRAIAALLTFESNSQLTKTFRCMVVGNDRCENAHPSV